MKDERTVSWRQRIECPDCKTKIAPEEIEFLRSDKSCPRCNRPNHPVFAVHSKLSKESIY